MLELDLPTLDELVSKCSQAIGADDSEGVIKIARNVLQLRAELSSRDPTHAQECAALADQYFAQEERTEDERLLLKLCERSNHLDLAKFRSDDQYRVGVLTEIASSNSYSESFVELAERHGLPPATSACLHIVWLLTTHSIDARSKQERATLVLPRALEDRESVESALRRQVMPNLEGTDHASLALCYRLLASSAIDEKHANACRGQVNVLEKVAKQAATLDYKLVLRASQLPQEGAALVNHLQEVVTPESVKLLSQLLHKTKAMPEDQGSALGHLYAVLITRLALAEDDGSRRDGSRMGEYMGHLAQKDWEWLTQQLVLSPGAHMVEVELRKQIVDGAMLAGCTSEHYSNLSAFLECMTKVSSLPELSSDWLAQLDTTAGEVKQLDCVLEQMIETAQPVELVVQLAAMLHTSEVLTLYESVIGRFCDHLHSGTLSHPQTFVRCVQVAATCSHKFGTELGMGVMPQLEQSLSTLQEPLELRIMLCNAARHWLGTQFEFMLTRLLVCVATASAVCVEADSLGSLGGRDALFQKLLLSVDHDVAPLDASVQLLLLWDEHLTEESAPSVTDWRYRLLGAIADMVPTNSAASGALLVAIRELQQLNHAVTEPAADFELLRQIEGVDSSLSARAGLMSSHEAVRMASYTTLVNTAPHCDRDLALMVVADRELLSILGGRADWMHQITVEASLDPELARQLVMMLVDLKYYLAAGLVILNTTGTPARLHTCDAALVVLHRFLHAQGEFSRNPEAKSFLERQLEIL